MNLLQWNVASCAWSLSILLAEICVTWSIIFVSNFSIGIPHSNSTIFTDIGEITTLIMRPSSLGGGRILRRTLSVRLSVCLSVRLSVCPSVPLSLPSVTSRHLANYNDTHVLFGTHWGPHIVRPSRPHKFLFLTIQIFTNVIMCTNWNINE